MEKKKMSKSLKITLISIAAIFGVFLILLTTVVGIWFNEIRTLSSINLLSSADASVSAGSTYEMEVKGDYYFDDFIAEGGASSDNELIDFIVKNITKGIIPIEMNAPEIGCAGFTAVTEDGDRLFGRNYDFSETSSMIVRTNPGDGRYASVSSADLGFLGLDPDTKLDGIMEKALTLAATYVPLDGVNEKGVSCGIFMSYQGVEGEVTPTAQDTEKPDLTSTTMLRMVLDYADSVESAVELIKKYDLHDSAGTSFHYMIADSTGKSAVLEWVNGSDNTDTDGSSRVLDVIYNDDDARIGSTEGANDFQYVTNFILQKDYYAGQDASDVKGKDRYDRIAEMINPDGLNVEGLIADEAYGLEILKEVGRRNWSVNDDSNSLTIWSALYNLTDKTVTWVNNEKFDDPDNIFKYSV